MDMEWKSEKPEKPAGAELIAEEVFIAERKVIRLGHYKNRRGEYLRIGEVTDSGYDAVIIPFTAVEEFHKRLGKLIQQK